MQTPLDERADLRVVEENVRIDGYPNVERFSIEWFLVAPAANVESERLHACKAHETARARAQKNVIVFSKFNDGLRVVDEKSRGKGVTGGA